MKIHPAVRLASIGIIVLSQMGCRIWGEGKNEIYLESTGVACAVKSGGTHSGIGLAVNTEEKTIASFTAVAGLEFAGTCGFIDGRVAGYGFRVTKSTVLNFIETMNKRTNEALSRK